MSRENFRPRETSYDFGPPMPDDERSGSLPLEPRRSLMDIQVTKPRVTLLDIALFASQWASMAEAGIAVGESLGLLERSSRKQSPRLAEALGNIRRMVENGEGLGDAFRTEIDVFGELPCEMIAAGEMTGTLDATLRDVAADCEYRHNNRSSLVSALLEPALIVVTGVFVCWVLMKYSVPQFATMYENLSKDGRLPLPTRVLIATSDFLNSWLGICLQVGVAAAGAACVLAVKKSRPLRYRVHTSLLRIPVFGELALLEAVARAARTLAVVQRSVGNMIMGLQLAEKTTPNLRIAEAFSEIHEEVLNGSSLHEAMDATGVFPETAVHMTRTGEKTGRLDEMLEKLAETFETRVRYVRERMTQIMRYGLLIVMGFFVISIMLCMYLPLFVLVEQMSR